VSNPQAANAVFTERCPSSGEFVASESVALAHLFPTDDPGARSANDGSLTTRQAAFLSGPLLDSGPTAVVALCLGLGILSAFNLRSFEAIDSPARPGAPPVSNWVNQQDDTTRDRHLAGYDPKGSLLDMAEQNVPGISKGEVRGGGCKPQEYPKKAEDRC
jgi:hypothetical protein